ncbi:MAG: hypothetical protein WBA77_22125 [Microcoleaceae cyanobacterium]
MNITWVYRQNIQNDRGIQHFKWLRRYWCVAALPIALDNNFYGSDNFSLLLFYPLSFIAAIIAFSSLFYIYILPG